MFTIQPFMELTKDLSSLSTTLLLNDVDVNIHSNKCLLLEGRKGSNCVVLGCSVFANVVFRMPVYCHLPIL